jgi:hypothetical protein
MDMEQLRKINALSNELKRHHMADSSMDAYSQAQSIVQVIPKTAPVSNDGSVVVQEAAADPLVARQFELEIQRIQKGFAEELDVMRNAMNQMIAEINSLREDLNKAQAAQPPKQKEKQVELKTEDKVPHARVGNFQPGDVDIQKMFYFGNGGPKR